MSVAAGTATDYEDLLDRLVTFLTTDATLTGLGQNWTLLSSGSTGYVNDFGDTVDDEVYLKAPGLSTTEAIYIQLQAARNTGYFNWRMRGATGYNSGQPWQSQPGASPDTFLLLWNTSIPYTFVANGQRVIVIAQIGSVFESAYLGKFLPYGQPSQYPYPVFVGGTSASHAMFNSDTTGFHSAFFDPSAAYVYWIDGSWQLIRNVDNASGSTTPEFTGRSVWPYIFGGGAYQPAFLQPNLDGTYPLFPTRLEMLSPGTFPASPSTLPPANAMGELDGVFYVPGVALTSGTTITVSGVTYLAVQNCFRTANNSFAAIKEP